jgi:hypothetical protein
MSGCYEARDGSVWRDGEIILTLAGAGWEAADAVASALRNERVKTAEAIADMIRHERNGLDNEDQASVTPGWMSHARARKWRDQDRAKISGYRIALSYALGYPMDFSKTDAFIDKKDYWEAL